VALGRALIKRPNLLLFDEPLSNLDARLRITMRGEIKKLQKDLGITSIYVTHDQIEAMTMADRIAVMKDGVLQAYTTPEDLHDKPKNLFVAEFTGTIPINLFDVEIRSDGDRVFAEFGEDIIIEIPDSRKPATAKGKVKMGLRPEDIKTHATTGLKSECLIIEPMGRDDLVTCDVGGVKIRFLADPALKLKSGERLNLHFNMRKCQFFDSKTGFSLFWK
jgi:ABC-type sugar transport system ATPase subunit